MNVWQDGLRSSGNGDTTCLAAEIPGREAAPEQPLQDREELRRVLQMMDTLPPRQREVLYLVAVEAMSLSEVEEVVQISRSAVKANLSLARKRMRELREAEG